MCVYVCVCKKEKENHFVNVYGYPISSYITHLYITFIGCISIKMELSVKKKEIESADAITSLDYSRKVEEDMSRSSK